MATPLTLEDGSTPLTLEDGSTPLTLEDDVVALGFALETDSALSSSTSKSRSTGLPTETDSAFSVSLAFATGQAVETDSALALLQTLGLAVETDSALVLQELVTGTALPLAPAGFSFKAAYPAVLDGGPDWRVQIVRPPLMTVTETILPDPDPEVGRTFDESHEEVANELGRFGLSTFKVDAFDIEPGDLVSFYDRGLCIGGGVIRVKETAEVGRQVEGKPTIRWAGVRPLGVLEEYALRPARGLGSTAQDRIWGWFGITYIPFGWIDAVEVAQYGHGTYWSSADVLPDFHDDTAFWIWARRRAGDPPLDEWAPSGECLFRQSGVVGGVGVDGIPIPAGVTEVEVELGGDAISEAYFEGEYLMSTAYTNANPDDVQRKRVSVLPGAEILLAVAVTNDPDPEGDEVQNPGGGIWAVWWIDPATGNRGGVIMHSDSSAVMLEYVTSRPGVTPGEVLLEVLGEAQRERYLTWVTPTFTREVDSAGRPWSEVGEIGTKVGYSLWKLCQQLIEVYLDADMSPVTHEWHAWSKGTRGNVTSVVYAATDDPETSNLQEHTVTETLLRGNVVLTYSKFGWQRHTDWTLGHPLGRKIDATLGLGALPSFTEVQRWARAELVEDQENRIEHDAKILPVSDADKPYWAYGIDDQVTIGGDLEIVQTIAWARDRQGRIRWNPDTEALTEVRP